jgi:hypothetical protein
MAAGTCLFTTAAVPIATNQSMTHLANLILADDQWILPAGMAVSEKCDVAGLVAAITRESPRGGEF